MNVNRIFDIAQQLIGNEIIRRGEHNEEEIAQFVVETIRRHAAAGPSNEGFQNAIGNISSRGMYFYF